MKNQERKIMVEVSPEEYEKIKAGALEVNVPTYEQVKNELINNLLTKEDVELIIDKHIAAIMASVSDDVLIGQIIQRTTDKTKPENRLEPMRAKEYMVISGTLQVIKRDYAQVDNPIVKSEDEFIWTLKSYGE